MSLSDHPAAVFFAWAGFALAALLGPGLGLMRLLRVRPDAALVLPLGLVACAAAYATSLLAGQPWLFLALLAALNLVSLLGLREVDGRAWAASLRGAIPPWLACLALLALTQWPWNRGDADGSFLLDPLAPYDDAVFHVGLARELTLGWPPQVPGLAGVPLGYHLGQGLIRAAALRFAGIEPFDQISRFDPVLLSLGLILALRGLAHRLSLSPLAVAIAGWSPLLTDFSFVFAAQPSAFYWTDLLKGNLLLSLVYVNPVVPGLVVALGAVIALGHAEAEGGRGWLVGAALLGAGLPHFKVFLGAHLLLGLAAAAVLARTPGDKWGTLAAVAAPCGLMTAWLATGRGGAEVDVTFAPFDLAQITRQSLDLPALVGPSFMAWCALWLFASLGLRWLGVGPALRALRNGPRAGATVAAMALSAWPLGLLLRVAVRDALPGQKVVNDAAYLVEQGAPLLWVFTAAGLSALAAQRGRAVAFGLLVLAVPATGQFVWRKAQATPDRLPPPMVRAVQALARRAQPGEVVIQRPGARYPPGPVLLANLRVPYERYTPFRTQFAPRAVLEARHQQVFDFFRTEDAEEAAGIARGLGARYVALYGTDRLRFPLDDRWETLYAEEGARVLVRR